MIIKTFDDFVGMYERSFATKETLEEEFPFLYEVSEHSYGFAQPMRKLQDALQWLWLKWHQTQNITFIQETLNPVIKRAVELNKDPKVVQYMREEHDSFLIQLAVLTGSKVFRNLAAQAVKEAIEDVKEYQYYQAWTGILKYRILGDEKREKEQYEIMKKYKKVRYFPYPTDKMVQAYVERDYKLLYKVIKQRCEKWWEWMRKLGALTEEPNGTVIYDDGKNNTNFRWPWPEGTFAKLAFIDGAEITYDSIWLPLAFVKATEK